MTNTERAANRITEAASLYRQAILTLQHADNMLRQAWVEVLELGIEDVAAMDVNTLNASHAQLINALAELDN